MCLIKPKIIRSLLTAINILPFLVPGKLLVIHLEAYSDVSFLFGLTERSKVRDPSPRFPRSRYTIQSLLWRDLLRKDFLLPWLDLATTHTLYSLSKHVYQETVCRMCTSVYFGIVVNWSLAKLSSPIIQETSWRPLFFINNEVVVFHFNNTIELDTHSLFPSVTQYIIKISLHY